jgi:hypothetical protein
MNLFEGNVGGKIYADFTHGSSSYNTFFRNHIIRDSSAQAITNALRAVDIERNQYYYNIVGNVLGISSQTWTNFEDTGARTAAQSYAYTWGYGSDGDITSDDPKSKGTVLRHCNYDYATQSTQWEASIQDHLLPNSLYLVGKPAFFGGLSWPVIGPDLNPMVGRLPAKDRFNGVLPVDPVAPLPPQNLKIIN